MTAEVTVEVSDVVAELVPDVEGDVVTIDVVPVEVSELVIELVAVDVAVEGMHSPIKSAPAAVSARFSLTAIASHSTPPTPVSRLSRYPW